MVANCVHSGYKLHLNGRPLSEFESTAVEMEEGK
jgi:hypothetical protein